MPVFHFLISGLVAYPTHQAVQSIGSTAIIRHGYLKVQPSKKSQKIFKDKIRSIVKHRTSITLEKLIEDVNPIIEGWRNYFVRCGYPRRVFFKLDRFVVGRFYRWAKRLSQRSSKCLTPDRWKILKKKGLAFFIVIKTGHVKGTM